MRHSVSCAVAMCASLAALAPAAAAGATYYPSGAICECIQPVAQTQYRSVPVTEFREFRQTVQRPVVETSWVDQQVTEYHPVVETRTAMVPTVNYETVTELHTVQRDAGFWTTRYQHHPRLTPCDYDPRPGLFGMLNRTGYSIRSAFTPQVTAHAEYVPAVVAETVPVTRQIAHHGAREVTYNVTRMEPVTTTRKVAVNNVRYVSEEVVRTQPVTVYRNVPIGTSIAWARTPYAPATATALVPTPEPSRTATTTVPQRTAESAGRRDAPVPAPEEPYQRSSSREREDDRDYNGIPQGSTVKPPQRHKVARPEFSRTETEPADDGFRPTRPERAVPSIVRVNRFAARPQAEDSGPSLIGPGISVADSHR